MFQVKKKALRKAINLVQIPKRRKFKQVPNLMSSLLMIKFYQFQTQCFYCQLGTCCLSLFLSLRNANKYYAKNDNIRYVKPQNNKKRRIVYVDEVDENEDDKEEAPQDPEPQEKKIKKTPTKKNIKN